MFPYRRTAKATKAMLLKHNIRNKAREINIIPGMHSTLVSIAKLADEGYTTVIRGATVEIYDDNTTKVTANKPCVLSAPRCNSTGLWKLPLSPNYPAGRNTKAPLQSHEEGVNTVFDLPSSRQTFLWYHAAAGFPTKETFLQVVQKGNFTTWPKLTTSTSPIPMKQSRDTSLKPI